MKKLIVIMAIAIVLVGAVFADPSSSTGELKVITKVSVVEPTFKLSAGSSSETAVGAGHDSQHGTVDGQTIGEHEIAINSLISTSSTSTTVTFNVIQTQDCKSYKTYTFSAKATDLEMTKEYDKDGALVAYTGTPTTANHRVFEVQGNAATAVSTFGDISTSVVMTKQMKTEASTASAYQIKYTGDLVEDGTEITTFTVAWKNDKDAVPGQYEAYVTLTVAAN